MQKRVGVWTKSCTCVREERERIEILVSQCVRGWVDAQGHHVSVTHIHAP